jgi:hypothetical protein
MSHPFTPTPGIGQIYASFDAASTVVFQTAIAHSRGGVLRLADLHAALATQQELVSLEQVPSSWQRNGLPHESAESRQRPATNEPAVRELLISAWQVAMALTPDSPLITPQVLCATALARSARPQLNPTDVFRQQIAPRSGQSLSIRPAEVSRPMTDIQADASVERPSSDLIARMDVVFDEWLQLQSLQLPGDRQSARTRLSSLTAEFERNVIDRIQATGF